MTEQLHLDLAPRYCVILCTATNGSQWRHRVAAHTAERDCGEIEERWSDVKAKVEG